MLVHFGKTYTATAKGSRVYSAKCEKCGQVYFYEQMLVASGSGTSPYFLNNLGAEDRAHASAQRALAREMKHGVDAVPCPKCHWVQEYMVWALRNARYTGVVPLAVIIFLIALVSFPTIHRTLERSASTETHADALTILIVASATVLLFGARILRRTLAARIDPNARYPHHPPTNIVGPIALRPADTLGEQTWLRPIHFALPEIKDGWLTVQLARCGWPSDACALCLREDADEELALPLSALPVLSVPLCAACHNRLKIRWWRWALIIFAAVMALVWIATNVSDDATTRAIVWGVGGPVALVAACVSATALAKPYRQRVIDRRRGFSRIRFENPAYTELLRGWSARPEFHAVRVPSAWVDSEFARHAKTKTHGLNRGNVEIS